MNDIERAMAVLEGDRWRDLLEELPFDSGIIREIKDDLVGAVDLALAALQAQLERGKEPEPLTCKGCVYYDNIECDPVPCAGCKRLIRINDYYRQPPKEENV